MPKVVSTGLAAMLDAKERDSLAFLGRRGRVRSDPVNLERCRARRFRRRIPILLPLLQPVSVAGESRRQVTGQCDADKAPVQAVPKAAEKGPFSGV